MLNGDRPISQCTARLALISMPILDDRPGRDIACANDKDEVLGLLQPMKGQG